MGSNTLQLGDVINVYSGGTPSKKNPDYWGGGIPWVSARSMDADDINESVLHITQEGLDSGSKLAKPGTILFLTRGSGLFTRIPVIWVNRPVAYNQDIKCIEAKNPRDARFIYNWLVSQRSVFGKTLDVTGIGAGKINTDQLLSLSIYWPDAHTRQRITQIADPLIQAIHLNKQTNDYLAELCEALAARGIAEEGTLADICRQVADKVSCEEANISTYVSTESLLADKGGRQTASSLPAAGRVTAYKAGDTLVSNIRPYFKKIWYADCSGTCSGDVIVFRATDPKLAPYVYACLRQDAFFEFVMAGSKGTKMPRGDKEQMMTFPVNPCCDNDDLATITSAAQQIGANNRESVNLAELRDALLPKLMSGEIDVSQIELPTQPNNHLSV